LSVPIKVAPVVAAAAAAAAAACRLRAFDAAAFQQCTAGRRVLFIGDSLLRQLFIAAACVSSRSFSFDGIIIC
jgi:hypothetical protein